MNKFSAKTKVSVNTAIALLLWLCLHPLAFAQDDDGDGVPDVGDNCVYNLNSLQEDWDSDGIGDACDDEDEDGLYDATEFALGTDPDVEDSDFDMLLDGEEFDSGIFDPTETDTDFNGYTDFEEIMLNPAILAEFYVPLMGAIPALLLVAVMFAIGACKRPRNRWK